MIYYNKYNEKLVIVTDSGEKNVMMTQSLGDVTMKYFVNIHALNTYLIISNYKLVIKLTSEL